MRWHELGVITGCLRISRESIFTGLNNLDVNTVLGPEFGDSFGFTDNEVEKMVSYYGLQEKMEEIRNWYDGYLFGDKEIYNPWSILNYVKKANYAPETFPRPYWSNTSSNSIVKELVEMADQETRGQIERLIEGECIEVPVHEEVTYGDIHQSKDNLWNILFFTGYLKACGQRYDGEETYIKMAIPNTEVKTVYKRTVLAWFDQKVGRTDLRPLQEAILAGDCEKMEDIISGQLMDTISFFDYSESYYHGFLAGLLKAVGNYQIRSNRESGEGRTDIIMQEPKFRGKAVVMEIKLAKTFSEMEDKCQEALVQIEEKKYEEV